MSPFRFPSALRRVVFGALALLAAAAAHAQITFTITGTAAATDYGYTSGQSYTFSFVLNTAFTNNTSSRFDSSSNYWDQELETESDIYTNIYGTGLSGTFVSPHSADINTPYAYVDTESAQSNIILNQGSDTPGVYIGLQTLSGTDLTVITATFNDSIIGSSAAAYPGTYTPLTTYWSNYLGTYTISGTLSLYSNGGTPLESFSITSVTISDASAVPEPATYAALLGLVALGLVARLRRHHV